MSSRSCALWWFRVLTVAGAICLTPAAWGQCGSGRMGARSLVGPSSMSGSMSPAWLMQMQAQMAQAQILQAQMAQARLTQAQLAQAQQVLMARGFVSGAQPPTPAPPTPPRKTRIKSAKPVEPVTPIQEAEASVTRAADAARLGADLVHGRQDLQDSARARLRDGKGADYTEALADTIGRLDGEARALARDALAERLARMTTATLRDKLADARVEVRRAAALACAMRDERRLVPDLIALMEQEPAAPIVPAVRAALKSLTDRDFGPAAQASQDERTRAVAAWKDWWQNARPN